FSFYGYSYHQHLHSFPTRRSSDLKTASFGIEPIKAIETNKAVSIILLIIVLPYALIIKVLSELNTFFMSENNNTSKCCPIIYARSEEHTSELQSRFDLVCRLLLEK